jgi:hypothetical protein
MFIFGQGAEAGMVGKVPDLTKANVELQYDYRLVYANIMKDWLLVPDERLNEIFPGLMTPQGTSDGVVFQSLPLAQQVITGTEAFIDGRFGLDDCFPNPAKEKTTFRFRINHTQHVSIRLYDGTGRQVLVVTDKVHEPGEHEIETALSSLPAGLYRYEMKTGFFKDSRSMVVSK